MQRMRGEGWKGIVAGAALALMAAPAMAQKTELLVYTALETDQIKAYETAFKAANPNIDVKWVRDSTGVVTARLAGLLIDFAGKRFVPDFPFKPESFFSFDGSVVAIGIGASMLACLLGALLPARLASRVDPAAALQGAQ